MSKESDVSVVAWRPNDSVCTALGEAHLSAGLIVLPNVVEAGRFVYPDDVVIAIKKLRSHDVQAEYLDQDPNVRTFKSEFSTELWFQIAVGIASNAAWELISAGLSAYLNEIASKYQKTRVQIARVERSEDGVLIEGIEIEGPAHAAADQCLTEIRKMLE